MFSVSPPSRTALLTLYNLGVEFDVRTFVIRLIISFVNLFSLSTQIKIINLAAGDHKTEEFGKLNPQRTVPTVDDDGFVMSESRAIAAYLVDAKSPNSTLYPTDPKARFIIDHRLFYDATVFSQRLTEAVVSRSLITHTPSEF